MGDPQLIAHLRNLLEAAETGQLRSLIAAYTYGDGTTAAWYCVHPQDDESVRRAARKTSATVRNNFAAQLAKADGERG